MIVGENVTFMGEEDLLRSRGVTVLVLQHPRRIELMKPFIVRESEPLERGYRGVTCPSGVGCTPHDPARESSRWR